MPEVIQNIPPTISWVEILKLLITYGPELFTYIMKKVKANGPVTDAELDELLILTSKPGMDYFKR